MPGPDLVHNVQRVPVALAARLLGNHGRVLPRGLLHVKRKPQSSLGGHDAFARLLVYRVR